eukprot:8692309-Heterocapsa_arctica.AAC.1
MGQPFQDCRAAIPPSLSIHAAVIRLLRGVNSHTVMSVYGSCFYFSNWCLGPASRMFSPRAPSFRPRPRLCHLVGTRRSTFGFRFSPSPGPFPLLFIPSVLSPSRAASRLSLSSPIFSLPFPSHLPSGTLRPFESMRIQ